MLIKRLKLTQRRARALIIYAALVCLCVSDGVGPRLLPYPTQPAALAADEDHVSNQPLTESSSSESPRAAQEGGSRPKLVRAGDAFKKLPVFASPELSLIRLDPGRRKPGDLSPPSRASALPSLRPGRGPPPSV